MISELEPAAIGFSNHTAINLDVIEQLAQKANLSLSTFQEHLRRAESKPIPALARRAIED